MTFIDAIPLPVVLAAFVLMFLAVCEIDRRLR